MFVLLICNVWEQRRICIAANLVINPRISSIAYLGGTLIYVPPCWSCTWVHTFVSKTLGKSHRSNETAVLCLWLSIGRMQASTLKDGQNDGCPSTIMSLCLEECTHRISLKFSCKSHRHLDPAAFMNTKEIGLQRELLQELLRKRRLFVTLMSHYWLPTGELRIPRNIDGTCRDSATRIQRWSCLESYVPIMEYSVVA